jgi:ABC-type multidrug transport system ATPase subunit
MDVVAGYKTGGQITGDIMIDGIPKDTKTWKHIMGYAEQNDILNPYLSVLETLRFTASCRLHRDVDREARVQEVIELMGLADYAKFVVGRELEGEGLPKHARKRLTIAVQLVIRPKVLFLDEPTTGTYQYIEDHMYLSPISTSHVGFLLYYFKCRTWKQ